MSPSAWPLIQGIVQQVIKAVDTGDLAHQSLDFLLDVHRTEIGTLNKFNHCTYPTFIADLHGCTYIEEESDSFGPKEWWVSCDTSIDNRTHLICGRPSSGLAIPRRLYTVASPVRPSASRLSSSSPSAWRLTQTRSSSFEARSTQDCQR